MEGEEGDMDVGAGREALVGEGEGLWAWTEVEEGWGVREGGPSGGGRGDVDVDGGGSGVGPWGVREGIWMDVVDVLPAAEGVPRRGAWCGKPNMAVWVIVLVL